MIRIGWYGDLSTADNVRKRFLFKLDDYKEKFEIDEKIESDLPSIYFSNLIREIYEKYKQEVVILIDDCYKPILDRLHNFQEAKEIQRTVLDANSILKSSPHLKFTFLISDMAITPGNIFGSLNYLLNISLHKDYANICGFTQKDVEELFAEYNADVDLKKIKEWYNGYYWFKDELYNPYDIINYIIHNYQYDEYSCYEYSLPVITEVMKKQNYFLPDLALGIINST